MIASILAASLLVPDVRPLSFAAVRRDGRIVSATPQQVLFIEAAAPGTLTRWTVVTSRPWLQVTPDHGAGPGRVVVRVAEPLPPSGEPADLRIRFDDGAADVTIPVALTMLSGQSGPPAGVIDAPADATVAPELVRFSGWALDDVAVSAIELCAERAPAAGDRTCSGGAGVLLGAAPPYTSARPDVAAAFPATPVNGRGGWSFVLRRDMLPARHKGTTRIAANAVDSEGHVTAMGTRLITLEPAETTGTGLRQAAAAALAGFLVLHAVLWLLLRARQPEPVVAPVRAAIAKGELAGLAGILLLAAMVDVRGLSRAFSYDEMFAASHFIVGASLRDAATATVTFNNHYAFSLLAAMFARALGPAEWALRLPALLLGLLSIVVTWRFVRTVWGGLAAAAAALLLALLPGFVEWSRSARGYSGLALMTVASTFAFARAARTGSRPAAACHAIALIAALYFHLYAVWVVAIQYGALLLLAAGARVKPRGWRLAGIWSSFAVVAIGAVLIYLPMLPDLAALMATRARTPVVDASFLTRLGGDFFGAIPSPVLVLVLLIALGGAARAARSLEGRLVLATIVMPLAAVWLIVRPLDLYTRYLALTLPLLACVLGIGVASAASLAERWRARGVAAVALLAVCGGAFLIADLQPQPELYYKSVLTRVPKGTSSPFVLGADAEMFDYYLGAPVRRADFPEQFDLAMRAEPIVMVVYHDPPWNSPAQRQTAEFLRRRCAERRDQAIVQFTCS